MNELSGPGKPTLGQGSQELGQGLQEAQCRVWGGRRLQVSARGGAGVEGSGRAVRGLGGH
jgi:hypothetical protein